MVHHHEEPDQRLRQPQIRATRRPNDDLTDGRPWHKPAYQVVEASMEMSAYLLAER
ncbi:hypothetical protein [Streptomyces sp. NPDC002676]